MVFSVRSGWLAFFLCLSLSTFLSAAPDTARFDLSGPKIDVRVTRDGQSLPIATVPNLLEGDHLWLHADLPETQSVKYLLVAVFLRGTTNPPPDSWIVRFQTWDRKIKAEGAEIIVPPGAQQVLLLLAPETGGDISALRSSIRARPGVFVRASQDLNEAGFEQARIEKYLDEMRQVPPNDTKAIAEHSELLARTLNLKPNADCFKKPVDAQYDCLTQSGSQSLLDDGHGQSIVNSLTSGASSDLINSASTTQMAGGGMYSAYVGSIVDVVRIMSNLHTAHYSYIPAIAFPQNEALNLRLNTPPSFENPKSVIVIGMPAVQKAPLPVLRASDAKHVTCLLQPEVTLPVEGAPLVFSTAFAHSLSLHRERSIAGAELPLQPNAFKGGLVVHAGADDRHPLSASATAVQSKPEDSHNAEAAPPKVPSQEGTSPSAPAIEGLATVEGQWGFDHFSGPTLPIQVAPGRDWKLTANNDHIILGEQNHLSLSSSGTACIQSVTAQEAGEPDQKLEWRPTDKHNVVSLNLSLHSSNPGAVRLLVRQFGQSDPETLSIRTFSKPAQLKGVEYHLGDQSLLLSGSTLAEIKQLQFDSLTFMQPVGADRPGTLISSSNSAEGFPPLLLKLTSGTPTAKLKAGAQLTGNVTLADGRTITVPFTVLPARPAVTILSRRLVRSPEAAQIQLLNPDDVPLDAQLMLSLRSAAPFPRDAQIEISSEDDSLHDKLSLSDGSLVLQDRNSLFAQLDLRKTFGSSAFGPLRLRLVLHDGTAGDWTPLATLVRLPQLTDLNCTATTGLNCALSGSSLYLLSSISPDASFDKQVGVPDGFVGSTLMVARPANGTLYLKLRDDPASVSTVLLQPHP